MPLFVNVTWCSFILASPVVPDYLSVLIDRSLTGIRAGDIIRTVNFLKTVNTVDNEKIAAVAIDDMGPVLLHAAVFDKTIKQVILVNSLISYKSIVMNKFYKAHFSCTVTGTLADYDLPDLVGCIAPRDVVLMNAAAVLMAGDKVKTLKEGISLSEEAIDSGRALEKLEQLAKFSQTLN